MSEESKKCRPICSTCGSRDVRADAYTAWSDEKQEWEIVTVFENTDCEDCGGKTNLNWVGI